MDGTGRFPIGSTVRDLANLRGIVRGNAEFRPQGKHLNTSDVSHVLVEIDEQYTVWIMAKYLTVVSDPRAATGSGPGSREEA